MENEKKLNSCECFGCGYQSSEMFTKCPECLSTKDVYQSYQQQPSTPEKLIFSKQEVLALRAQLNNQDNHKESLKKYWLSCSESKAKWVEAIKEYFDSEHTESIQSFDDFKSQFDLD